MHFTVLVQPYLPDLTQPGGDMGLRLWAADGLGFVMAPTALPQAMLHTKPTPRPAEATQIPPPFIANLYIQVRRTFVMAARRV